MARRVFFSFHFERDVWRAGQVRNSWVTKADRESAGFWDAADWEEVKKKGDEAIKKWIDKQLEGTSVTAVLIGAETSEREYVGYEISQSHKRGNGLLGIYINKVKDSSGKTDVKGKNPFDSWYVTVNGQRRYFSEMYKTYDWIEDDGYNNFSKWVETAAKAAGR
ncbi:MAG: TIR domain-containing protein [Alphaproteobacteria bacterium]|nr:TIR domain-containing protein [Alphaproteobacteria bacterium]